MRLYGLLRDCHYLRYTKDTEGIWRFNSHSYGGYLVLLGIVLERAKPDKKKFFISFLD